MKASTKFLSFAVVMVMFILLDACKAEKGDVGPAGAAGANGTNGATGATGATGGTGATGATGATGTANVIYSDWISVTFTGSLAAYTGIITAPKLTQEILDKGLVQTYFKNTTGLVNSLNFYQPNGTTPFSLWAYNTVGKINMNGANYNPSSPSYLYRYILVPGGVGARKAAVDYTDYEAVKKYYNLPD